MIAKKIVNTRELNSPHIHADAGDPTSVDALFALTKPVDGLRLRLQGH